MFIWLRSTLPQFASYLSSFKTDPSMRMEKFEEEFVKQTRVKLIVGKGGMGPGTERACKKYHALHLVYPAGNAVYAALHVNKIVDAQWKDLGMPETLWACEVKDFGPLIVSIDTNGDNLFEKNKVIFNERKEAEIKKINEQVKFIK
ncbi:L-tartrate dehydratase beta subunit [Lactiplantibacillus plantarum]|nr:L-tartrate dehydratase beta subunit [Lactiplantibacillus plantarum]